MFCSYDLSRFSDKVYFVCNEQTFKALVTFRKCQTKTYVLKLVYDSKKKKKILENYAHNIAIVD